MWNVLALECTSQAMLESNQESTTKVCGDQAKSWDREPESQKRVFRFAPDHSAAIERKILC